MLFLVDRGNLGDQPLKEFQQYVSPYNNFKFTEEFIVQRLASNTIDTTARVCICTIQRLYSMLRGRELSDEDDETSVAGLEPPGGVWGYTFHRLLVVEAALADVVDALGLSVGQWNAGIRELKESGAVVQIGERRGARYVRTV